MKTINVLIAIQARSNSTRFPKKIYELIGNKRVLEHVIDRAKSTAAHIERYTTKIKIKCEVAVLHPAHDTELVRTFNGCGAIMIGGDEQDVLSRFVEAQKMTDADYVVRLTSDCPLIMDFVIAKHIHVAAFNHPSKQYDYISNIEEECRFVADGFDCEVMSRKALDWLDANATDEFEREHVSLAIRKRRPRELKQAFVSFKLDTSHMKMSVDTPDDLMRMRRYHHDREHKMAVAKQLFGTDVYEL